MLILLISTQKSYFCDNDAIYDVIMQEPVITVITTDIKSAVIHLLNNHSLRPSQSFSFLDKSTGPYLPFVVLALSCGYAHPHIMSFIITKFPKILLSGLRGVALTRKAGLTDWLTDRLIDWLTDGSKTLYLPQLVEWGTLYNYMYLLLWKPLYQV